MAMSMDYAEMVEGCLRRRSDAERALYDEFAPVVYGVCLRYARCREDAGDLLQDSMVKVFEKIGSLHDASKLKSWIYTIAVNTCVQYCRKSRLAIEADPDAYSEAGDELPYSAEDILKALESVTPAQRAVFNLCCIEELDFRKVASILNCTETNVRGLLFRAKAGMRKYLESINELTN